MIWLVKREDDPYVEYHAREALNFQISLMIYIIVSILAIFVFIGLLMLPVVAIWAFVVMIIAGVKAANGESYRYPFIIRFVSF